MKEKLEKIWDIGWGVAPLIEPKDNLSLYCLGAPHNQKNPNLINVK